MPRTTEVKTNTDQYITASELAKKYRVSEDCIYRMVRQKKIPHIRFLTRVVFEAESINAWEKEQLTKSFKIINKE